MRVGEIPAISALTQAMISGAKNHQNILADIERTEKEALEAMKNKDFPQVGTYQKRRYGTVLVPVRILLGGCLGIYP